MPLKTRTVYEFNAKDLLALDSYYMKVRPGYKIYQLPTPNGFVYGSLTDIIEVFRSMNMQSAVVLHELHTSNRGRYTSLYSYDTLVPQVIVAFDLTSKWTLANKWQCVYDDVRIVNVHPEIIEKCSNLFLYKSAHPDCFSR